MSSEIIIYHFNIENIFHGPTAIEQQGRRVGIIIPIIPAGYFVGAAILPRLLASIGRSAPHPGRVLPGTVFLLRPCTMDQGPGQKPIAGGLGLFPFPSISDCASRTAHDSRALWCQVSFTPFDMVSTLDVNQSFSPISPFAAHSRQSDEMAPSRKFSAFPGPHRRRSPPP